MGVAQFMHIFMLLRHAGGRACWGGKKKSLVRLRVDEHEKKGTQSGIPPRHCSCTGHCIALKEQCGTLEWQERKHTHWSPNMGCKHAANVLQACCKHLAGAWKVYYPAPSLHSPDCVPITPCIGTGSSGHQVTATAAPGLLPCPAGEVFRFLVLITHVCGSLPRSISCLCLRTPGREVLQRTRRLPTRLWGSFLPLFPRSSTPPSPWHDIVRGNQAFHAHLIITTFGLTVYNDRTQPEGFRAWAYLLGMPQLSFILGGMLVSYWGQTRTVLEAEESGRRLARSASCLLVHWHPSGLMHTLNRASRLGRGAKCSGVASLYVLACRHACIPVSKHTSRQGLVPVIGLSVN